MRWASSSPRRRRPTPISAISRRRSAKAIRKAAERVAAGEFDAQFPIDVFQTGSGTSSNMNANEVIAHVAATAGVEGASERRRQHGQSSNDVIPTAIQVSAALTASEQLLPALAHLKTTLDQRARELREGRQDRPHASDGRDAGDVRPGTRRLGRADPLQHRAHHRRAQAPAPPAAGRHGGRHRHQRRRASSARRSAPNFRA